MTAPPSTRSPPGGEDSAGPILTGAGLRSLRRQRGLKQDDLSERLGVSQSTVSRWEAGLMAPSASQLRALHAILGPRPSQAAHDAAIRGLVEGAAGRVHLVCDRTHRLLAASGPRWAQWRRDRSDLEGACMLRFASAEILEAEARLPALGWFDGRLDELVLETGTNGDAGVPIAPGRFRWRQVRLADGAVARLVQAL